MSPIDITCSIVTFKNDEQELKRAINSVLNTPLPIKLFIVDNSPSTEFEKLTHHEQVTYIHTGKNIGFGKAHNIAITKALPLSRYHLVLNPDVSFGPETLHELLKFLEEHRDVGLILPKVLDFETNIQHVCKRLPSPLDLILRRFGSLFFANLFKSRLARYEMQDRDYNKCFEAPYLSGCFMLFRNEALEKTGLFDERFFMYMEDIDLSRRMLKHYKNMYYPNVHIHHGHARESYGINKLLFYHIMSAIKYFNKWGWRKDPERELFNNK